LHCQKEKGQLITKYKHLIITIMTTKNFNAKKMLMSAVAAVVFSFVVTTNANARSIEYMQQDNLEVRVKDCPNGDSQQMPEEDFNLISFLLQIFGVRV
jgi:uncharacterized protein YggU (UPF0235/DUF167 family)